MGKVVAMAWWGTGGHVFPIRSLLSTLAKNKEYSSQVKQIFRFWTKNSLEQQVASEFKEVQFQTILSGKFRREKSFSALVKNVRDFFLFFIGVIQSLWLLRRKKIDVIFCKGGYVALPVVVAGKILRKKIIVHESDTHPGLVNRIASKRATKTFTGFENIFPKETVVGQILSEDLFASKDGESDFSSSFLKKVENLDPSKTILFVSGGSQGAKSLYESLLKVFDEKLAEKIQMVVSLGKLNVDLQGDFEKKGAIVFDFLSQKEMGYLYSLSDLAVSRGGTTSLAEQKIFHLKTIIVPIPRTHDQMDNALYYEKHFHDIVLDQEDQYFEKDLGETLREFADYKKEHFPLCSEEVTKTKEIILQAILG